jgi:Na+-driven multidrug efflux pump
MALPSLASRPQATRRETVTLAESEQVASAPASMEARVAGHLEAGYDVMFILAIGMLARAAVGPAERLLNMLGERKPCAIVYAIAFAINLTLCIVLIPHIGIDGAAVATSAALIAESAMFYGAAKRRLGFQHLHSWQQTRLAYARSRKRRLMTLPVVVIGMSSMNATSRGYSCADRRVFTKL